MINTQLLEYIKRQIESGVDPARTRSDLSANGWNDEDINEALANIKGDPIGTADLRTSQAPVFVHNFMNTTGVKTKGRSLLPMLITILVLVLFGAGGYMVYSKINNKGKYVAPEPAINSDIFGTEKNKKKEVEEVTATTTIDDGEPEEPETIFATNSNAITTNATSTQNTRAMTATSTATSTSSSSNDPWFALGQVNIALKNKDVSLFNKYSYSKINPNEESQFAALAQFLYEESSKINKADYVTKWQDEKQAIYTTIPKKSDDDKFYGYSNGIIMFIKQNGSWIVLQMTPNTGASVLKSGTNSTPAQIEKLLQDMMLDSDKDGLTNDNETCSKAQSANSNCVKTDPNKRDTNGNGWWDGIDVEMKKS